MNIAGFKERLNENTPHACYTRTTRVYATNSLGNTPTVDIAERSNGKNDNYQSNKIGKKKNKKRHASARFASRCLSELLIGYSAGLSGQASYYYLLAGYRSTPPTFTGSYLLDCEASQLTQSKKNKTHTHVHEQPHTRQREAKTQHSAKLWDPTREKRGHIVINHRGIRYFQV